jgi:hypothetical protein
VSTLKLLILSTILSLDDSFMFVFRRMGVTSTAIIETSYLTLALFYLFNGWSQGWFMQRYAHPTLRDRAFSSAKFLQLPQSALKNYASI